MKLVTSRVKSEVRLGKRAMSFFEEPGHAGTYPSLVKSWEERGVSKELIEKVSRKNFLSFF